MVAVGFIHPGTVEAEFAVTLAMNAVSEKRLTAIVSSTSARINRARTSMIEDFLRLPSDRFEWLWLVDADMVLPVDALSTLLETAETQQRKLVGGLGYIWQSDLKRILPSIIHDPNDPAHKDAVIDGGNDPRDKYGFIYNTPPEDEPRFIEAMSTGAFCLLVHRSVLVAMKEEIDATYCWFDEYPDPNGNVIGADLRFFERARNVTGETPLIDTHVRCGHIKKWTLTHEEAKRAHGG